MRFSSLGNCRKKGGMMVKVTTSASLEAGFENSFAALPEKFYDPTMPELVKGAVLQKYNQDLGRNWDSNLQKRRLNLLTFLPATCFLQTADPLPWPMPGISSAGLSPSLAMAAPLFWVRKLRWMAGVTMFSSKARAGPGFHGAVTAGLH